VHRFIRSTFIVRKRRSPDFSNPRLEKGSACELGNGGILSTTTCEITDDHILVVLASTPEAQKHLAKLPTHRSFGCMLELSQSHALIHAVTDEAPSRAVRFPLSLGPLARILPRRLGLLNLLQNTNRELLLAWCVRTDSGCLR